uniref:Ig-like domain-containing protein n=1 Tax=Denticeps clupeoides TaxID=299321 RepID=A0AAY4DJH1_9TELE
MSLRAVSVQCCSSCWTIMSGFFYFSLLCSAAALASAKVDIQMEDRLEVFQGERAEIQCNYSFSTEPHMMMIQWFVKSASGSRVRISYSDLTTQTVDGSTEYSGRINVSAGAGGEVLTIRSVRIADEREFFCEVNGMAAGSGEEKTHLAVFEPPEGPLIEGVHSGISVSRELPTKVASCEARNGFPKPNITWYRNQVPLRPTQGQVNIVTLVTRTSSDLYTVQSDLQYKVTKEDRHAFFSCEASFLVPGDTRTSTSRQIGIIVHYPTTKVELWKERPRGLVKEGDTVEIRCRGDGNPPSPLTFNREQQPEVELDSEDGTLTLHEVTRRDSGVYQCRSAGAESPEEVVGHTTLTVHYLDAAIVVPRDSEVMFKGESLTATCNALSSLNTTTVWFKSGEEVGRGHTLVLQDATFDTAGEYVCAVTVPSQPDMRTTGSVHIVVEGAPEMKRTEGYVSLKERAGKLVNLSCDARGRPRPIITWSIAGSQSWREVANRVTEDTVHSLVTVKLTSDTTATCNATSDMGSETRSYAIEATTPEGETRPAHHHHAAPVQPKSARVFISSGSGPCIIHAAAVTVKGPQALLKFRVKESQSSATHHLGQQEETRQHTFLRDGDGVGLVVVGESATS